MAYSSAEVTLKMTTRYKDIFNEKLDLEFLTEEEWGAIADTMECAVNDVVTRIASVVEFENAKSLFYELDEIQIFLAQAAFKYEKKLSYRMRNFVRKFDRLDDVELMQRLYSDIRAGRDAFG